jgi:hypothetical protein
MGQCTRSGNNTKHKHKEFSRNVRILSEPIKSLSRVFRLLCPKMVKKQVMYLAKPVKLQDWSAIKEQYGMLVVPLIEMVYGDGLYVVAIRLISL